MSPAMPGGRVISLILWSCLLCVVVWAYYPGLKGPLLLDDFANLNPLERMDLSSEYALDVVQGNTSGPLGRPVSMASFALERLYLDYGLVGQKTVGLALHMLNSCLILMLCWKLFSRLGHRNPYWLAVAVAALWVSMPLLISTTLYVVQRMTLLAATFSLLAMLAYCMGRERQLNARVSWYWFPLSAAAIILSVLSKENGILTVPMLVILEVFFYRFQAAHPVQRSWLLRVHIAAVVLPLVGALILFATSPAWIFSGYQIRDFTLWERLLTQSRVLFDYLGQIIWVDVHRLGVYHDDYVFSTSVTSPLSTLWALFGWVALLSFTVWSALRGRLLAVGFGVALFITGHALESTVFPLELYFEHRNYLPSVGILFALVAGCSIVSQAVPALSYWLALALVILVARNTTLLGSQAVIWSDSRLLHIEAMNYHPQSERAMLELARIYALDRNMNAALELLDRAGDLASRSKGGSATLKVLYFCFASEAVPDSVFEQLEFDERDIRDLYLGDHVYYVSRAMIAGQCSADTAEEFAASIAEQLLPEPGLPATVKIYASMMLLENHLENYDRAMAYADRIIEKNPRDVMGLQFMLYLSHALDDTEKKQVSRQRLMSLRDKGELSRQETANLELFMHSLDNSPVSEQEK